MFHGVMVTMNWDHLYLKQIKHLVKATAVIVSGKTSFSKQTEGW